MYRIIVPVVDLSMKPMSNLSETTRKRICTCDTLCKSYITIDDHGRFCEHDAREIGLSLISLVEGLNRVEVKDKTRGWTYDEIEFIKDFYAKKDGEAEYGDTRLIATMLNRSHSKTQTYIKFMRRRGDL